MKESRNFHNRKKIESLFKVVSRVITWSSVALLFILIFHLMKEGMSYLNWHFLSHFQSRFPAKSGMKAGILGSLLLISVSALFTIPIGVASAIFLEEYKIPGKFGKIIEINIANLAGVPSIVYGLLGLSVFVRAMGMGRSLLAGGLTLGLLVLPVIIVASREAIKAVPDSLRQAAYALGASKYQVVFGHVLPVAFAGIMTGIILAISRAIGEAAPLIVVGALSYVSFVPESINDEFTAMPIQIYNWAGRPQEEFHKLAATGILVLLVIMLGLNFVAIWLRDRSAKKVKL